MEPKEAGDRPSGLTGDGLRVLVVEDSDVGRFCIQALDDLGYATQLVTTAEETMERLGEEGGGFDVVFSDVVMPGMGGIALARTLRERLPGLPVILTSGYSHVLATDADHGFELLHEPYSADRLGEMLRRVGCGAPAGRVPRAGAAALPA